ncbi:MAG: SDR family oxidoreductase [Hyphomicrobiaceae bacterium]
MNFQADFSQRNIFVSGGTSGINLGIAKAFARCGACVGVMSRSTDKVENAVRALEDLDATAYGYSADVRDAEAVARALSAFARDAGEIETLISGAAGNFLAPANKLSPNGFKTVVDIDLLGTFNVMKAAYPHLRRPGGSIINISAPQSYVPMELQVHACAAKAGVDQVTRTLALEWGPEGIRVNSISPGPIQGTEGMERLGPGASSPEAHERLVRSVALRRMGEPEDIADAALFLASDAARYISGVVLPVDGGWGVVGPARAMQPPASDET